MNAAKLLKFQTVTRATLALRNDGSQARCHERLHDSGPGASGAARFVPLPVLSANVSAQSSAAFACRSRSKPLEAALLYLIWVKKTEESPSMRKARPKHLNLFQIR